MTTVELITALFYEVGPVRTTLSLAEKSYSNGFYINSFDAHWPLISRTTSTNALTTAEVASRRHASVTSANGIWSSCIGR